MKKAALAFLSLFVAANAEAFSHAACLHVSQTAPYNMSTDNAKAVCDAKNTPGGNGKTANVIFPITPANSSFSDKEFSTSLSRFLDAGNLRLTICHGSCNNVRRAQRVRRCSANTAYCREMTTRYVNDLQPACPLGYNMVLGALGNLQLAYTTNLGGPKPFIRAGLCRKN